MKARVSSRHVTHGKVKENDSYLSELVQREQDMSKIGPLDDGDAWDVGSGLVEAEDDVLGLDLATFADNNVAHERASLSPKMT